MPAAELGHLELLAEVDALSADLNAWAASAPEWTPARHCHALVRRLSERADSLRVRMDAPLVVATLGGTGSGKSTLVNALVGADVVQVGKERPTTRRPTLICRPDITPEMLGIDAEIVNVVTRDIQALRDIAIIDCPDPDTTEELESPGTNLSRLREIAPHCDVLLVVTTQQKYNSARVASELLSAAPGARLVFVQTHADVDDDIREDWRRILSEDFEPGEIFFIDSLSALRDAKTGVQPRGEFGRLVELLTHELAGAATKRIRRANFLDLVAETLSKCKERLDVATPMVDQLEQGIIEQRGRLSARLAGQMREELLGSRGAWESRLLTEVATRWGFSPFACVLRLYNGIGNLVSGSALFRMRTPAQIALWGAVEGARRLKTARSQREADAATGRAVAFSWDEGELRTAAIIVDGYAAEAGLPREGAQFSVIEAEAATAGASFVSQAAAELQSLVRQVAAANSGWLTRFRYELLFAIVLVALLYRFARNFFYDSWLAVEFGFTQTPAELLGTDFFIGAAFVLILWSAILLWLFTGRLRRGLNAHIAQLAAHWTSPQLSSAIFARLESQCRDVKRFHSELERLIQHVADLERRLAAPSERLGRRALPDEQRTP